MNRSGNRRWNRAPWTLALLTTVCAELTFTAVAVPFTWLLVPLLMVMYGAGVLVLREATVRAGGTWPSLVLLGVAYRVVDVTTSVLPTDTFEAVQIADPRTAVAERLPWRTRTDATGITPPPGTRCEHYSASTDLLSADLYRLCWADGRLSSKDLIRRPAAAPGTIGT